MLILWLFKTSLHGQRDLNVESTEDDFRTSGLDCEL